MISTKLKRYYDPTFTVSDDYKASMPDLQNAPALLIEGANVPIQQVGISSFKLPLKFPRPNGELITLETSVDGYVGLGTDKKGINMSRIIRTFYRFKDEVFHPGKLEDILAAYKNELETETAYLRLTFNYPILKESLRSNLEGYQYYRVSYEGTMDTENSFRKFVHLDFPYSSACPCSYELSEHAKGNRGVDAIPHSQRSIANLTLELEDNLFIEDVVDLCREALMTETQVMVKREDEQAFAELNAAFQKFVEDAVRLLYEAFNEKEAVKDFVIRCVHMESLHSHDAVSRICKGLPNGLR